MSDSSDADREKAREWADEHETDNDWGTQDVEAAFLAGAEYGLSRAGLTWTATPPKTEGHYWVRNRAAVEGVVVLIEDVEGNLWIDDDGELARYLRQFPEAEWAGPLPLPPGAATVSDPGAPPAGEPPPVSHNHSGGSESCPVCGDEVPDGGPPAAGPGPGIPPPTEADLRLDLASIRNVASHVDERAGGGRWADSFVETLFRRCHYAEARLAAAESALAESRAAAGRLREALKPFAALGRNPQWCDKLGEPDRGIPDVPGDIQPARLDDCRRAAALLAAPEPGPSPASSYCPGCGGRAPCDCRPPGPMLPGVELSGR